MHLKIKPLSLCPKRNCNVLNLKAFPGGLKTCKRGKVANRQVTSAKQLRQAGIFSQESLSNVEAAF